MTRRITDRLDWTIKQRAMWTATRVDGVQLVARKESELMSKINAWEAGESEVSYRHFLAVKKAAA